MYISTCISTETLAYSESKASILSMARDHVFKKGLQWVFHLIREPSIDHARNCIHGVTNISGQEARDQLPRFSLYRMMDFEEASMWKARKINTRKSQYLAWLICYFKMIWCSRSPEHCHFNECVNLPFCVHRCKLQVKIYSNTLQHKEMFV